LVIYADIALLHGSGLSRATGRNQDEPANIDLYAALHAAHLAEDIEKIWKVESMKEI